MYHVYKLTTKTHSKTKTVYIFYILYIKSQGHDDKGSIQQFFFFFLLGWTNYWTKSWDSGILRWWNCHVISSWWWWYNTITVYGIKAVIYRQMPMAVKLLMILNATRLMWHHSNGYDSGYLSGVFCPNWCWQRWELRMRNLHHLLVSMVINGQHQVVQYNLSSMHSFVFCLVVVVHHQFMWISYKHQYNHNQTRHKFSFKKIYLNVVNKI